MPAGPPTPSPDDAATIRRAAACWVVRQDRGLSEAEAVELEQWLLADPRHTAAMERSSQAWRRLDEMPVQVARPIIAASVRRAQAPWQVLGGLAAAMVLLLLYVNLWRPSESGGDRSARSTMPASATGASPQTMVLRDGSVVRLKPGTETQELFSATERRVRLVRGEAYFAVTKDPVRPFIVEAGDVRIRAVGTAFNVSLQTAAVDVLVTEGTVEVNSAANAASRQPDPAANATGGDFNSRRSAPLVVAGQRAVVALAPQVAQPVVVISEVDEAEAARMLAWRGPMLRLGGATLAELAVEFERQTGRRLVLADPALGALRVGGRFPADDIDGFVHVLQANYGIQVDLQDDGTLVLGRKR